MNKRVLLLFMLKFVNSENLNKIHNLRDILNIEIGALRKVCGLIPECNKCQSFNHTLKGIVIKNVLMTMNHRNLPTTELPRQSVQIVRAHHPVSYKDCEITEELQNLRYEGIPSLLIPTPQKTTPREKKLIAGNKGRIKVLYQLLDLIPIQKRCT